MDPVVLEVVRVLTAPDGSAGNPLGVFLDGHAIPADARQAVAAELGFSETVFVDDPETGRMAIFTPGSELTFAGHPTVGTAWLHEQRGSPVSLLRPPAGPVATWREDDVTWIRARADWVHRISVVQLAAPADVEAPTGPPAGEASWYPWAWIDEATGVLRSRYFFDGAGISEDEATGAAAVVMGGRLRRSLEIHHGRGSVLHVRPGPEETVEVGGRCAFVESRVFG